MVKKLQPKYGAADGVDPPHDVRWEIDGTEAREGIDPAKGTTQLCIWSWIMGQNVQF